MLRHLLLTIALVFTTSALVFSQTGSGTLKGKITDKATKEPIPFANVVVEIGGVQVGGSTSDFDGNFLIKPIPPGKVDLKATYVENESEWPSHWPGRGKKRGPTYDDQEQA